jgi:mRNA interferase RelE/StbE
MKTYQFSHKFKKDYRKLPQKIQITFDKKLSLLLKDMSHPSLRVKRIQGTADRWEGSVTMKYRFTFQLAQDELLFRAIGTHDILIKESKI